MTIEEALNAAKLKAQMPKLGKWLQVQISAAFLTPDMASKNDARYGIGLS